MLFSTYYSSATVEHNDVGVIEIAAEESNNDVDTQQDMLRRRLVPGGLSEADKIAILKSHNKYRNTTAQGKTYGQPSASNMNQLIWDDGLAQVAQDYSSKCIWAHNKERSRDLLDHLDETSFEYTNQQVGENLFITTGTESLSVLLKGVQYWYNEYMYYTYGTTGGSSSCQSGQQCGHYTQMVWANTRYVGCGYTKCPSTSGVSMTNGVLLVCNYYFAGNVVGYAPYKTGTPGSECQSDRQGENNMCGGCPSRSWDTYCCEYCSSSTCSSAKSSNMLNSPSTCTDGLGTSLTSSGTSGSSTVTSTTKAPTNATPAPTNATPAPTNATPAPTIRTATSTGCCKVSNTRYASFCNSISSSSMCNLFSTVCYWDNDC